MTLITKIQYRNYEPGEFTEKQERTYEDTIRLIEEFPWEQQREHFPVNPTGPSVTIEGNQNDYLKLAPQSYTTLQAFFENRFSTESFKLEKFWIIGKAIHFKDQDFHYRPKETRIILTIALVGAYCIFMLISIIALLIFKPVKEPQGYIIIPIFNGFIRIEMQSTETPFIFIPYMVLNDRDLTTKLAGCPQRRIRKLLPFIPLGAATPS